MKITDVRTIPIGPMEEGGLHGMPRQVETQDGGMTSPRGYFYEPQEKRSSPMPMDMLLVIVDTDVGISGIGTAGCPWGAGHTAVIDHHLKPVVLNQDPFDVEVLWERMFRDTIGFGRKGMAIEALSAIDVALWDIMGKATGQPVYNLLGGRTRTRIQAYASRLYANADLDLLASEARLYVDQGFTAMKQRFAFGPRDGLAGMRRNMELVKTVRDAVGPDIEVAADAFMGWDAPYAIRMIHMLEDAGLHLSWVEEPVIPDDISGYAQIRAAVDTRISGGEHEFTRYGFRQLIDQQAVDIVQFDITRCGGITEARKICALASVYGLPAIPHATRMHNHHLVMSHMNIPLTEYFPLPLEGFSPNWYEMPFFVFQGEPRAEDGYITLPESPGLGIEVNWDVVDKYRMDR